jgi:hypothetical protein
MTGQDIKVGMIIQTATELITVERVVIKWGAVQVTDGVTWWGLGLDEAVTLEGHFNPGS